MTNVIRNNSSVLLKTLVMSIGTKINNYTNHINCDQQLDYFCIFSNHERINQTYINIVIHVNKKKVVQNFKSSESIRDS